MRARGALALAVTGWGKHSAMSTREKLRSIRLSLRFIAPLAVTLALLAYGLVPLVDRLTLRWWVSDLDTRSQLIANTLQDQLPELAEQGATAKINSLFMRAIQDERLYALANEPKQFVRFSPAGHEEVDMYGAQDAVRAFLVPPSPEETDGAKPVIPSS